MQIVSNKTICMKSQIMFSWKNNKNVINLWTAEILLGVLRVK